MDKNLIKLVGTSTTTKTTLPEVLSPMEQVLSPMEQVLSPMEQVLTTEYINDIILDNLTTKELNTMRTCSKDLQKVISDYSEHKINSYLKIINRKIPKLLKLSHDNTSSIYATPYIVIYNYYHAIIRYSCLILEPSKHTEFQRLMRSLHDKKIIHLGPKYTFDTDRYKKTDVSMHSYSLFDIMTCIYLCNTGSDWASYHWSEEGLDVIKFLQGKLLPSS